MRTSRRDGENRHCTYAAQALRSGARQPSSLGCLQAGGSACLGLGHSAQSGLIELGLQ